VLRQHADRAPPHRRRQARPLHDIDGERSHGGCEGDGSTPLPGRASPQFAPRRCDASSLLTSADGGCRVVRAEAWAAGSSNGIQDERLHVGRVQAHVQADLDVGDPPLRDQPRAPMRRSSLARAAAGAASHASRADW
jgi:hypothetical protein